MNRQQVQREAKFRAGLILESVLNAGWSSDDAILEKYGDTDAEAIGEAMACLADRLIQGGRTP